MCVIVGGNLTLLGTPRRATRIANHDRRGILLAIGASFLFGLMSCLDRNAVSHASPTVAGFVMTLFAALFMLPFAARVPHAFTHIKTSLPLLSLRGMFEVSFMVTKLYVLTLLEAAYVVAILKASLLVSIVGGRVFFQEGDFTKRLFSGVLIFIGIVIIALERL